MDSDQKINTLRKINEFSLPLQDNDDLDPLMDKIGNASIVLLGEASHGTHEYYAWRSRISKRLIEEKGFSFIAVEGDWPDCYRLNRYIKSYSNSGENVRAILHQFNRWPSWIWANWEMVSFANWLLEHNQSIEPGLKTGFYGLDVYSLWESLEAILDYLEKMDPITMGPALDAFHCFEPHWGKEGKSYAKASYLTPISCQQEVIDLLKEIRTKIPQYNSDRESHFNLEQNALVAVNAERYYRNMVKGGTKSWNIRDQHMADTLNRLLHFHGPGAKAIVWEHNTHIGDARATDMAQKSLINLGQLLREQYKKEEVFAVGMGAYEGSVIAGRHWGDVMRKIQVPPAQTGSWEALLHKARASDKLILIDQLGEEKELLKPIPHRAIGVIYNPSYENYSNYVPSIMPQRYDAFIYFDKSRAIHPLHNTINPHQTPETYPFGF